MLPVIHLFGIPVSAYLLAASLACASFWVLSALELRRDVPGRIRLLLPPAVILSALVGARILHAALNPFRYGSGYPIWTARYERLCLMGGLVLGTLVLYAVCHELELPFFKAADDLTAGAGTALTLLKLGCFLNGCCVGVPTAGAFGMVFPAREPLYDLLRAPPEARRVWPVPLFECAAYLIGIAVLLLIARKRRLPDGTRFLVYALYVTAVRLAVHPLRDYAGTAAKIVSPILYVADLLVLSVLLIRQIRRGRGERKKDRRA